MTDFDDTHLRAALRDLHDAALPGITPPGLPAVQRKARRRVALRFASVTAAVIATLLVILLSVPLGHPGPEPIDEPTASPTPDPSRSATTSPSPTLEPSDSSSVQGGQAATCDANPRVEASYDAQALRVSFGLRSNLAGLPVCAGANRDFAWVSFRYLSDGSQVRYGESLWLALETDRSLAVRVDSTCPGDLYFVGGDTSILSVFNLAPGQHHPVASASAANNWRGVVLSYAVYDSPCAPPSPPATP